jgi:ADP-heptose:LPS heptosyltransferase
MTYRNILIFKPGAIGDLLHITPAIRAVKRAFPGAEITLLTGSNASAELFRYNSHVTRVMVYERKGEHRRWGAFLQLWRTLRAGRFDLVVNYQRSNLKGWLLLSAAFPCRVLVYHKARGRMVHAVENHLEAVAPLGIDPLTADRCLELHPGPEDERWAEELIRREGLTGKPLIVLNPGASNPIKCWSTRQFAELGERLQAELGAAVLVVGGPGEENLAAAIRGGMAQPPLELVGRTSLLQLAALLARAATLVSGDTGPLHLATAVGTPVVALFGAIDPNRTGPVGEGHLVLRHPELPCVPCNAQECANAVPLECMARLSVDEVLQGVRQVLARQAEAACGS